jgi:FkbM family methyltransferase
VRYDRATDTYYRPGDKLIIEEVPDVYGAVPVMPGDVVLDLGAHIGLTSRYLLDKGAAKAIAVEADPANLPLLRRNLRGRPVVILAAAVGPVAGRIPFYTRPDRGFVGSILADPKRRRLMVPMVPFGGLLKEYRPTIVKADIEFSEYELPDLRVLPDHVRVLAMEVHIRYTGIFVGRTMDADELRQRRERAADFIHAVEVQGFAELWRKDKQVTAKQRASEEPAEPDASGLGPLTKCVCAVWARA